VTGETATILMNLVYEYDSVDNVSTLRDRSPSQGNTEAFTYDPLDRLVSASGAYAQSYSYNAIGNFVSKAGVTQSYGATQPHAVRSLSDGSSFQYDANGNMTQRTEMSGTQLVTYQQQWDIDNHLVVVTNTTTGQVTQYFYDADGTRVKRIGPQGTTVYVNTDYEVTGPSQMVVPPSTLPPTYTHKLYLPVVFCSGCNGIPSLSEPLLNLAPARVTYRFNSQQVAVREDVTLTFVYGDHLGSASLTADASGAKISEMRYYPYGEVRYTSGSLPSERTFTGQRAENVGAVGSLMDYGARFYSPVLGRFISADSIVLKPGASQTLDRYAYTYNNPLKYTDTTGHCPFCVTALVGGLIGGVVFGATYAATSISSGHFDAGQFAIATAAGAGAGLLIGSGLGIVAGYTALSGATAIALGGTLIGAGVGAGSSGEAYMYTQKYVAQDQFDTTDFLATYTANGLGGAVKGSPLGRTVAARIGVDTLTGATQAALSDMGHGRKVNGLNMIGEGVVYAGASALSEGWNAAWRIKAPNPFLPNTSVGAPRSRIEPRILSSYILESSIRTTVVTFGRSFVISSLGNIYDYVDRLIHGSR
jgi:RHS repeat-associated protein